ncbi:helix-turn-helix domain-containing protein [Chryseobacterium lathyri]|uniref:Excisionase family DNA binding protein n=1 Tax=Chryseobacterium lathyri TaxID=395933 RepID=A0ABT9SM81_9FLAO|nr:helix-turn-helix domain-containing protein [Chryseobacterium lathyri]MDP9960548.1 excisionase family DNA binding protein [Chryseobacterium lathyri]MDQ0067206.1 excisionase family DNA binding protein [Chryseobacterium lathyri]
MKTYSFEEVLNVLGNIELRLQNIETCLLTLPIPESSQNDFIGAKEACEILKLSLPTLYSKVSLREIPCFKKGNRLHFSKSELLAWISEGRKKSVAEINQKALEIVKNFEKRKRC